MGIGRAGPAGWCLGGGAAGAMTGGRARRTCHPTLDACPEACVCGGGLARGVIPTVCPRATLPNSFPLDICHLVWPLWVPGLIGSQACDQKYELRVGHTYLVLFDTVSQM